MSTFELATYTELPPSIHLDEASGDDEVTWMGHVGNDGSFMLQAAVQWAAKSGITGEIDKAFSRFFDYARKTYMFPDQDSVCLFLRKVMSNDEYKIPRPHHDGIYWDEKLNAGRQSFKIGTVLCGPSTLFWDTSHLTDEKARKVQHMIASEMRERARVAGTDVNDLAIREWATGKLQEMGAAIVRLKANECARWVVGDRGKAAIHSEPDMTDMPDGRLL